jgi:7,8-dihydropterin-6-yl-methyl-4-(beta-D-ribofuranosyl)aminobenzene 5'-phosphate synthase
LIRITTLVENSPGEHLALHHEHGISFCIETEQGKVLFDTGQSDTFIKNAKQLRIDLADLDYVVLSHGHYDHSGGFKALSEVSSGFELVVGKGFFNEKYAAINGGYEFLGNNFTRDFLEERNIRYSEQDTAIRELIPGVFVLGQFPRKHEDEIINPRFQLKLGGEFVPDTFDDEVLVVIDTDNGLVVLLGCSHPGMRNLLDAAKERFQKPIYAVMGGTHLVEASEDVTRAAYDYLRSEEVEVIGVSHCTGKRG